MNPLIQTHEIAAFQILSLESWLAVSLDNSEAVGEEDEGQEEVVPKFSPLKGLKCLHAHVAEAASQMEETASMDLEDMNADGAETVAEVEDTKQVWDLMMALWGKLEGEDL